MSTMDGDMFVKMLMQVIVMFDVNGFTESVETIEVASSRMAKLGACTLWRTPSDSKFSRVARVAKLTALKRPVARCTHVPTHFRRVWSLWNGTEWNEYVAAHNTMNASSMRTQCLTTHTGASFSKQMPGSSRKPRPLLRPSLLLLVSLLWSWHLIMASNHGIYSSPSSKSSISPSVNE